LKEKYPDQSGVGSLVQVPAGDWPRPDSRCHRPAHSKNTANRYALCLIR
jgi:hypothetical protein